MNTRERIAAFLNDVWFEARWFFCNDDAQRVYSIVGLFIITTIFWLGIFSAWDYCFRLAHAYTDEQIVNAIYKSKQ